MSDNTTTCCCNNGGVSTLRHHRCGKLLPNSGTFSPSTLLLISQLEKKAGLALKVSMTARLVYPMIPKSVPSGWWKNKLRRTKGDDPSLKKLRLEARSLKPERPSRIQHNLLGNPSLRTIRYVPRKLRAVLPYPPSSARCPPGPVRPGAARARPSGGPPATHPPTPAPEEMEMETHGEQLVYWGGFINQELRGRFYGAVVVCSFFGAGGCLHLSRAG